MIGIVVVHHRAVLRRRNRAGGAVDRNRKHDVAGRGVQSVGALAPDQHAGLGEQKHLVPARRLDYARRRRPVRDRIAVRIGQRIGRIDRARGAVRAIVRRIEQRRTVRRRRPDNRPKPAQHHRQHHRRLVVVSRAALVLDRAVRPHRLVHRQRRRTHVGRRQRRRIVVHRHGEHRAGRVAVAVDDRQGDVEDEVVFRVGDRVGGGVQNGEGVGAAGIDDDLPGAIIGRKGAGEVGRLRPGGVGRRKDDRSGGVGAVRAEVEGKGSGRRDGLAGKIAAAARIGVARIARIGERQAFLIGEKRVHAADAGGAVNRLLILQQRLIPRLLLERSEGQFGRRQQAAIGESRADAAGRDDEVAAAALAVGAIRTRCRLDVVGLEQSGDGLRRDLDIADEDRQALDRPVGDDDDRTIRLYEFEVLPVDARRVDAGALGQPHDRAVLDLDHQARREDASGRGRRPRRGLGNDQGRLIGSRLEIQRLVVELIADGHVVPLRMVNAKLSPILNCATTLTIASPPRCILGYAFGDNICLTLTLKHNGICLRGKAHRVSVGAPSRWSGGGTARSAVGG